MSELVGSYQQLRESGRGIQIVNAIIETSRKCNLDKDVPLPEVDASIAKPSTTIARKAPDHSAGKKRTKTNMTIVKRNMNTTNQLQTKHTKLTERKNDAFESIPCIGLQI